jgi:hypothetical protein
MARKKPLALLHPRYHRTVTVKYSSDGYYYAIDGASGNAFRLGRSKPTVGEVKKTMYAWWRSYGLKPVPISIKIERGDV